MTITTFYDTRNGKVIDKDPSAILDYSIDWNDWLSEVGDSIASSTWSVPAGLTAGATTHADGITTVWLSGGTAGSDYAVTNRIITSGGRQDERSFIVRAVER